MVMMTPSSPSSKQFFLTFSPDHGMQISFLEEKKFWIFFGDDGDGDDDGDDTDVDVPDCNLIFSPGNFSTLFFLQTTEYFIENQEI